MRNERYPTLLLIVLALLACTGFVQAQEPSNPAAAVVKSHIMVTPAEIVWSDCPPALPKGARCAVVEGDMKAPNALFALRVKMPDNFKIPPHFHPADEHLVVLSGVFNMGHGDKFDMSAPKAITAHSFVVIPRGAHHFAWTKGETIVQVYAIGPWGLTYVNPKDDPRHSK